MPWWGFFLVISLSYLLLNLLFAAAYTLCGPGALSHIGAKAPGGVFVQAFFFSVQTFGSIGYGRIAPLSLAANWLVVLEALAGLFGLALATGIIFARFSGPLPRSSLVAKPSSRPTTAKPALCFRWSIRAAAS